jgi:hypothetical protein
MARGRPQQEPSEQHIPRATWEALMRRREARIARGQASDEDTEESEEEEDTKELPDAADPKVYLEAQSDQLHSTMENQQPGGVQMDNEIVGQEIEQAARATTTDVTTNLDFSNEDTDKEYMCSFCQEPYSACSYDPGNPSHPFLFCEHRFCRQCIEKMKGGQDCPVTDCRGTNDGRRFFELDEELIRRIIEKSCSEEDGELVLNNGVVTDNVAGSSRRNQSLTSG